MFIEDLAGAGAIIAAYLDIASVDITMANSAGFAGADAKSHDCLV